MPEKKKVAAKKTVVKKMTASADKVKVVSAKPPVSSTNEVLLRNASTGKYYTGITPGGSPKGTYMGKPFWEV